MEIFTSTETIVGRQFKFIKVGPRTENTLEAKTTKITEDDFQLQKLR